MKKLFFSLSLLLTLLHPAWASSPTKSVEATGSPDPVTKKVLVIIQDPILTISGQTKRLHEYRGTNPNTLISQIYAKLNYLSHGYANYVTVESHTLDEFPVAMDGFQYNQQTYLACLADRQHCNRPNDLNYAALLQRFNVCEKIQSGLIDEVVLYGGDEFGYDELAWKIPNDVMPYATPTNPWLYQLRKKNLPSCGRSYFVMGYNYFVGLDNAVHSFGHRIESAVALTVGRGFWDGCAGNSDFDLFTCQQAKIPAHSSKVAGCGNIHYPPNAAIDYNWDSSSIVRHHCYNWANYPAVGSAVNYDNCTAWGCNQQGFIDWWMRALPASNGVTKNGNQRNWWSYAVDYDEAVSLLPWISDLKPTPIISPSNFLLSRRQYVLDSGIQNLGKTASPPVNIKWTVWKPDRSVLLTYAGVHESVGASQTLLNGNSQLSVSFPETGTYTVQFQVDHDSQIMETDKSNNTITMKLDVYDINHPDTNDQ